MSYELTTASEKEVVLTGKSKFNPTVLIIQALFFSFWYYVLLSDVLYDSDSITEAFYDLIENNKVILIFLFAPLLMFALSFRHQKRIKKGNMLVFSRESNSILKNHRKIAPLEDLEKILLEAHHSLEDGPAYKLLIKLKRIPDITLISSTDTIQIDKTAKALGDLTGVHPENKRVRE
ncbi:MAG: hypothetical protein ACRBF0_12710 [Calditrichia bacterium]